MKKYFLFSMLALLTSVAVCCSKSEKNGEGGRTVNSDKIIRPAWGAGRWFPADPEVLKHTVESCMKNAGPQHVKGRILAAVAPHAGYQYSGPVAGYTFEAIRENAAAGFKPDTVVVIGLCHRAGYSGVALMDGDIIRTPLGDTLIDREAVRELDHYSRRIFIDYRPHKGEHSAENEIPFIQAALPDASLVVALIGDHEEKTIAAMAEALDHLAEKKSILVVASSDMLHDPDYALVTRTDRSTLQMMKNMRDDELLAHWSYDHQILCGIAPVVTAMRFARDQGCRHGTVLHYRNSGDDFPESRGNWVVGYGAVVFTETEQ